MQAEGELRTTTTAIVEDDESALDDIASTLRVLGHPVRLRMLGLLHDEMAVGQLAARLDVAQPVASQHLRQLRDHGLVQVRREGTHRLYSTDERRLADLRLFLDGLWRPALLRLRAAAERRHGEQGAT